jgi:hypothetical protein
MEGDSGEKSASALRGDDERHIEGESRIDPIWETVQGLNTDKRKRE